ncbi:hypothetical protein GDO86_016174 [Hymenochirus boettgeri]|uniref:Ribosome receptor lysine/proline rich domain-containing protein n=1 Tax=Hymenochirus boettgeri TaxID=247094 RepID=A0A8T2JYI2_9PIPI|nr:hypothetical protein GDO86_016174 [Hymenochirus boettgeri]
MEFYESTAFIVLVPSVVITVIFLFFWLFMKETSYDEILAKQKKDQKPPPAKVDKKKTDKKKSKKKESQNGNLHESDSETAIREFDLVDALSSEEEHVVPTPIVPAETLVNVRERAKKEKKQAKPTTEEKINKEVNGTKVPSKKPEPAPITKQPTPPPDVTSSKKKSGQKKQKNGRDNSPLSPEVKNEQVVPSSKKQEPLSLPAEVKPQDNVTGGKKKASVKKQKVENVSALVDEPLIQPTVYIPLMDNTEVKVEKKQSVNLEKPELIENPQKSSGKKMKIITDKENAEVKFKDFLVTMKHMVFSEDEALSVVDMLKGKSSAVQEIIHKANKGDAAALQQLQEKEKHLIAAKDEATIVKEQCKKLTQELVAEKQKFNLVEAKARERINLLEKEQSVYQSKMHGSFQEAQQMQVKFQQVREQLENQITHLKQENTILRDAVSSATNQMESKQSNELNKLRQDYARLMNELTEKNNRMAQEDLQKKNSEQAASQLKGQMQEAERRLEEVDTYLRKIIKESEATQQDLQAKLITKESEIQSLHSKLTDTMVSKQQLEEKIMQLMDATQGDSLQMQVQDLLKQNEALNVQIQKCHAQLASQSTASVLVEELQKTLAHKDKEIKQIGDSLALERANFANSGEELKDILKKNEALNAQMQNCHSQLAAQSSALALLEDLQQTIAEKDKEIKQMQDSLSLKQTNLANSGEEFKALQRENMALKSEIQSLHSLMEEKVVLTQALEQMKRSVRDKDEQIKTLDERLKGSSNIEDYKAVKDALGQLKKSMQEKDEKIKTVEELLEAGLIQLANKEAELRILRDENELLLKSLQDQQTAQVPLTSVVEQLKNEIHEKEGKIKSVQDLLHVEHQRAESQEAFVKALKQETETLKEALGNSQLEKAEQVSSTAQIQKLQKELRIKEDSLINIKMQYTEREKNLAEKERRIQDLDKECNILKVHIGEMQQQLKQDGSTKSQTETLQSLLSEHQVKVKNMETALLEKEKSISNATQELKVLREENNVLKIQACELQQKHEQQIEQVSSTAHSEELLKALAEKDRYVRDLLSELESLKSAVEQQRKKNNEQQQLVQTAETEARQILQKIFPNVSVSAGLSHGEWVKEFEKGARNCLNNSTGAENVKAMEQKMKEGEEIHTMLQLECEKYKSVLAETEGILQRLQRSVEEEEGRWKLKVEESQQEVNKGHCTIRTLEQELEKLRKKDKETEILQKERDHLETELERAESERATYVSEVRELKDLLTELQRKLDDSYSEAIRQNEELSLCVPVFLLFIVKWFVRILISLKLGTHVPILPPDRPFEASNQLARRENCQSQQKQPWLSVRSMEDRMIVRGFS